MKIAHVLTRFSPEEHPGGVERLVDELAKRQAEEHEIEIICRNQFNDPEREEKEGYTVKRAPCLKYSGLRTISSLYTMRKLVRNSDADVYHIHDWSPFLNYVAAGMPGEHVLTLHNLSANRLEGFAVKKAERVTCVSKWLSQEMEGRHGVRTETVTNGADLNRFENKESEGYMLFVGSLIDTKGVKETCEVSDGLERDLKIVGTGPMLEELKQEYDHEFLGRVPDQKLVELYSRCDFLILPSRREGFGLVWIEALASGKPVIATETGIGVSLPEECGEIISMDYEPEELGKAVARMEERSFDREEIQDYAERNFGIDKTLEKYMELYQNL